MQEPQQRQAGLQPWQQGIVFLLACTAIVSRRPDAIFHAQFFAEDGRVWFADAYRLGWWSPLFQAHTGYFQTLPRLGAALALLVPFALAPLVLNLVAIAVQALPVNLLLSSRSAACGSLRFRTLLACVYLALPNCAELSSRITSSQWLLALSAFLVLVAAWPMDVAGWLFDLSILLLCGLTGPFCFFLLPVALILAWKHREPKQWSRAALLSAACLVQAWGLLVVDPSGRSNYVLGASPQLFTRILAGHVYIGALLGGNGLATHPSRGLFLFLACVALAGTALVTGCFVKSAAEMKLFLAFSAILFAASLISPTGYQPAGITAWANLAAIPGIRYWFFPTLAFAWSIAWFLRSRSVALKSLSAVLLVIMCFGIVRDWNQPAYKDMHFADYAARFAAAPAGTAVSIPENPEGWTIQLFKH
ncbi:MAG: hypothetical protein P4K94_05635 [Terracidiphilus sp.]|nr:hypothetical protein [Terracidiphilus sp.]